MRACTSAQLISIARRGPELVARVTEGVFAGEFRIEAKIVPLADVKASLLPDKARLIEAWNALAVVRGPSPRVLQDVRCVLAQTVPEPGAEPPTMLLPAEWDWLPEIPRATAAHPRAYRGTKSQPPKPKRKASIDLRPFLADARSLTRILAREDWAPPRSPKGLPAAFVQWFWWRIRDREPRVAKEWIRLLDHLDLGRDEALRSTVCHLQALAPDTALSWCRAATAVAEPRRLTFLTRLLETEAYGARGSEAEAREVSELAPDDRFAAWTGEYLAALRDGRSAGYILAGVRLAAAFSRGSWLEPKGWCASVPEDAIAEAALEGDFLAVSLWEACGMFPELAGVLRDPWWRALGPEDAVEFLRLLQSVRYYDDRAASEALVRWAPEAGAMLLDVPAGYRVKAIRLIEDWLWDSREPRPAANRLDRAIRLAHRLSVPPFETSALVTSAGAFLRLDAALLARVISAPDSCFTALEQACRRHNDDRLISGGLAAMASELCNFTASAFLQHPKKLMAAARVLGVVSGPASLEIARACKQDPLFLLDPAKAPVDEVCRQVREVLDRLPANVTNPVPARLSAWLRGEITLSASRLDRYARVLAERLMLTRLDLIRHAVLEWLGRDLPVSQPSGSEEHALRMVGDMRQNRRGLRRFLRAYWSGDRDFLGKHPATVAWYRKHPAVRREIWESGVELRGEFTIRVERDPLEVLKLGTYAGTCLGIGGICVDSAAAAVLDANKQVLYARDRRGRVVARQLVAISDDDRLVCFHVYPESARQSVRAAFSSYDQAFAEALGLPLYKGDVASEPYSVANVIAPYWWDDGNWD